VPFDLSNKLVVAVASSALFDLTESQAVFDEKGIEDYRRFQREHQDSVLKPGPAFPLTKRLLALNGPGEEDHLVEVILLSKNDPDTGLRVFKSIDAYGLPITRAAFLSGGDPFLYMDPFNASLFLSADEEDVRRAVERGLPAGRVFPSDLKDEEDDVELRIAFDFDGVVADDSSEAIFKAQGMEGFRASERAQAASPMRGGPLARFFREISRLQEKDRELRKKDPTAQRRLRTAIVTARSAPAHERVVSTLREWNIEVDEVFFLGGVDKAQILSVFKPHIFFDDQLRHIESVARVAPCVHVPFGVVNEGGRG
jgi:5'-nucleotidase